MDVRKYALLTPSDQEAQVRRILIEVPTGGGHCLAEANPVLQQLVEEVLDEWCTLAELPALGGPGP